MPPIMASAVSTKRIGPVLLLRADHARARGITQNLYLREASLA
jgi:hypothetical protein